MTEPTDESRNAIQQAVQAIKRGDRTQARRWASLAARLDPSSEQPWLILASLAAPSASVAYLKIALEKNPQSEAAHKAMHWAVERYRHAARSPEPPSDPLAAAAKTDPGNPSSAGVIHAPAGLHVIVPEGTSAVPAAQERTTLPRHAARAGESTQPVRAAAAPSAPRTILGRPMVTWAIALVLVAFLALTLAGAAGSYMMMNRSASAERAVAMLFKPSLTPTNTPTPTPTNTPTATPTNTPTATPTATATSTETPTPTDTPTPLPTDTPVPPVPTDPPGPTFPGLPDGVSEDEFWIDVDLTNQTTYAYQGYTLINSFVVSTGTWQHPTVTGTYTVYVKYRYTDMSGPGYYLADVPYTMYFYKGYGLHGTYWHNNFGTPMSHGCVNLRTDDAGWLFDRAVVGTVVNVHY